MGGGSPPRGGAGRSRRGPEAADEVDPVLLCWVGLTRLEGCLIPRAVPPSPRAEGHAQACVAWAGPRTEAWEEKTPERQKPRRGTAGGAGRLASARTDSQEDQGFEAGEVGGTWRFRGSAPGGPGGAPRRAEREPIVVGGIRQLRYAWASMKPAMNGPGGCVIARRWITAREHVAPRGARDSCEGNTLKGESQERLRHETGPRNSGLPGNR